MKVGLLTILRSLIRRRPRRVTVRLHEGEDGTLTNKDDITFGGDLPGEVRVVNARIYNRRGKLFADLDIEKDNE